jgi:hypothetical protein
MTSIPPLSREELLHAIDIGTQQLADGEFTEYDEVSLRAFIDDVQARGLERYKEAQKQRPT